MRRGRCHVMWEMSCDMWKMSCDMWNMLHDTWGSHVTTIIYQSCLKNLWWAAQKVAHTLWLVDPTFCREMVRDFRNSFLEGRYLLYTIWDTIHTKGRNPSHIPSSLHLSTFTGLAVLVRDSWVIIASSPDFPQLTLRKKSGSLGTSYYVLPDMCCSVVNLDLLVSEGDFEWYELKKRAVTLCVCVCACACVCVHVCVCTSACLKLSPLDTYTPADFISIVSISAAPRPRRVILQERYRSYGMPFPLPRDQDAPCRPDGVCVVVGVEGGGEFIR